ncbi:MAG TPA: cyclic nucleotide-binding domain-containing protein [Usitatibacter sp.]|jgi:CRP-like cAMP-binding protein|nr:cyclic nucleotide-binding domain-containing protein [Usitatibacter sp.]
MERPRRALTGNLVEKLSEGDRARLFALGRSRVVEAGGELVRQGTAGDCLFIVEEGEVAVVRALPGDEEEVLIVAGAGMILGEMSVLDGGMRAASLRAVGRCVVRVVGIGAFEALTLHGGEAGHRLLRSVAAMVHERLDATCAAGDGSCSIVPAGASLEWSGADRYVAGLLGVLPAFASFDAADREALVPRLRVAELRRGEEVVLPHGDAPGVTMVLRGALSPWLDDEVGPDIMRPAVGPGWFVDYAWALGLGHGTRRWRARSPTRLLRLDAELFEVASPFAARLLYTLSRDLASTLRRATALRMHFEMAWAHRTRRAAPLRAVQEA